MEGRNGNGWQGGMVGMECNNGRDGRLEWNVIMVGKKGWQGWVVGIESRNGCKTWI